MYRILILISLLTCGYVLYLYFTKNKKIISPWRHYFNFKNLITHCPGSENDVKSNDNKPDIQAGIYCGSFLLTVISFCLLATTGFLPVLLTGHHLSGLFLIIHVTIAPVFVLSVTILILLTVHKMRFDSQDLDAVRKQGKDVNLAAKTGLVIKIEFWIAFVLIIVAIMAIILMMYPIFGETGQNKLLNLHKYSTLILFFLFQHQVYLIAKVGRKI
jgi:hypothetical protein